MTDTTPNLALPEIAAAQAQKHVTHNEALRVLDAIVHLAVLDRDLVAPPDTPVEGQRWLVGTPASGDWTGHDDEIAAWQDGGWQFYAPHVGWLAYVTDEQALVAWSGSAWEPALDLLSGATELQNMALLGVGTTADETNPFSAKLNNALWVARAAAEGGDGDLRYKLSKEAEANTLSLLFQDNFSGRAEIGLTGDDDFHFKVSDDGSVWRDAIVIDKSTGQVSFPQGGASSDLELTVAELALGVADALNVAQFLGDAGNRVADSFDALTYVDAAGATNLDTGTAGVLKPTSSAPSSLLPTMTGATTAGVTISASSELGAGFEAYLISDGDLYYAGGGTAWFSNDTVPAAATVDFGSGNARTVASYKLYAPYSGTQAQNPKSWTLEGSNNGSTWTTLDTVSGYTSWGAADGNHPLTRSVGSPAAYRYYRLNVTAIQSGAQVGVAELRLYSPGMSNNLTVASTAFTAAAAPSSAKVVVQVKEIDGLTLNTDLICSVSRDGGATWSDVTLRRKFIANAISICESATLDLSAQPSGTAMKWKVTTANNKAVELHGIYLSWS